MAEHGAKRKTVAKVLHHKVEDWLRSIDDSEVREIARRNTIVTGGSIVSMLMGDPINDFDVYFKTKEATIAVANYYCRMFHELNPDKQVPNVREEKITNIHGNEEERVVIWIQSQGMVESDDAEGSEEAVAETRMGEGAVDDYLNSIFDKSNTTPEGNEKPRYRPIFLSQNAITLSDKMQLVIRFYGEAEDIHKNYDFEHVKNVWDHSKRILTLNPKSLECILSKTLHYTGSLYPICSLFRARKFIERGWRIGAGEFLKMAMQITKIDITNVNVLKEQLVGCDLAYFRWLINDLVQAQEDAKEKGMPFEITDSYVIRLVDKVFNDIDIE